MFLLDTTVVSDYLRGDAKIIQRLGSTMRSKVYISSLTKLEVAYGINKKPRLKELYQEQMQKLFLWSGDIGFDSDSALVAARVKHELISQGKTIGIIDIMIGAIALQHGFTVVTSNTKHFTRIKDLKVIDWKK